MADDRIVGPLDTAAALRHGGTLRASAALTSHVLEVVEGSSGLTASDAISA